MAQHIELLSGQGLHAEAWSEHVYLTAAAGISVHATHVRLRGVSRVRAVELEVGAGAQVCLDLLDASDGASETWTVRMEEGALVVLRALHWVGTDRAWHVECHGHAANSTLDLRLAVMVEHGAFSHRADVRCARPDQAIEHSFSGISFSGARSSVESLVALRHGSLRARSRQRMQALSVGGRWMMRPDLVIDHQDVDARHGACHGVLDEAFLEYAAHRGLDFETAHRLYLRGFLARDLGVLTPQIESWLEERMQGLHV